MSLESELQAERVSHLDLSGFSRIESGASVRDALALLRAERHNVCLVTRQDDLVGILTDRDVLRKLTHVSVDLDAPVDDVMTQTPIVVSPDASAADALRLMDEHHFRNLPVVDEQGEIVGDMTHQTIVAFLAGRYPVEVLNRSPRPQQFPRKAEGG